MMYVIRNGEAYLGEIEAETVEAAVCSNEALDILGLGPGTKLVPLGEIEPVAVTELTADRVGWVLTVHGLSRFPPEEVSTDDVRAAVGASTGGKAA